MGHGDKFVLSDANFPSYSQGNKLYLMKDNVNQLKNLFYSIL